MGDFCNISKWCFCVCVQFASEYNNNSRRFFWRLGGMRKSVRGEIGRGTGPGLRGSGTNRTVCRAGWAGPSGGESILFITF